MSYLEEQLSQLRDRYLSGLEALINTAQNAWDKLVNTGWNRAHAEDFHQLIHKLSGSAGNFGLTELSAMAFVLEQRLSAQIATGKEPATTHRAEITGLLDQVVAMTLSATTTARKPHRSTTRLEPNQHIRASNTIYLVDDNPDIIRAIENRLQNAGYQTRAFANLKSFQEACCQPPGPAAIVMDMIFPEGSDDGSQTIRALRCTGSENLPVIFISVRDDLNACLAALRSGATRYLTKPLNLDRLVAILDDILLPPEGDPYRVLLVDDDPPQLEYHALLLDDAGMVTRSVSDPLRTFELLDTFSPDAIVLDVHMPQCTGMELAAILREREECATLPILFLSTQPDPGKQMLALDLGGDDFLVKPVNPAYFAAVVAARAKRARRQRTLNNTLLASLREQRYQQFALDQHAIVSKTDVTGRITQANDRFCEISGYSRAELLGQNHRLLKSGAHDAAFYSTIWKTISAGHVWQGELCNRRKDGSLYWVESTIVPFLDEKGIPYQYVSVRTDITAIKAVEAAERRAKDRLSVLLASSPIILYSLEPDNGSLKATWVSDNIERLLGYTVTEALAPGWWYTHLHADDRQKAARTNSAEALEKGDITHEYCFQRKDGSYIHVLDQFKVYHQPSGAISEIIGGWTDITELRKIQEELKHNEERLRRSQVYANIGTWDWNITTGDLYWSERIAPLFGHPEDKLETTYENFLAAVHAEDRQDVIDAVNACVKYNAEYNIEHRCQWPDGTVHWLQESGDVVRGREGTPLHMLGVVQDITQRKEAELALRQSRERLREAQRIAHLGSWEVNLISGELSWSGEVYRIFGQNPDTFTPSYDSFFSAVHPDDRALVLQSEQYAREAGIHDITHRIVRPDGSIRFVHELAEMNYAKDGTPASLIGTVQDVTTLKEAELALISAKEDAENANRAKSEFLSSMSHELRTPMNAILGFAQLLEVDTALSDSHREGVNEILNAGRHLLELINEVLDLARIESGRLDLAIEPMACAGLIDECISLVRPLAEHRGITLYTDHDNCGQRALRADRMRLKQVLLNLISNAVKYNRPDGSVAVEIRTSEDNMLRVCVTDTGAGIPTNRQQEIFHPFSRLGAEKTNVEGTGIGLVISKQLVEMMGGSIGFDSTPGEGSTFWFDMPIAATEPASTAATVPDIATKPCRQSLHTVLYVEDNPANLKLVAQLLAHRPHIRLLTAHVPELGLDLALAHRPDLILLDINMPGMDGYTLLNELRKLESARTTPIIAITAKAMASDIQRGLAAGFDEYLTKPLDVPHFLKTVDRFLGPES